MPSNLAHAAADQLGVLGSEIENEDILGMNVEVAHGGFRMVVLNEV